MSATRTSPLPRGRRTHLTRRGVAVLALLGASAGILGAQALDRDPRSARAVYRNGPYACWSERSTLHPTEAEGICGTPDQLAQAVRSGAALLPVKP